LGGGDGDDLTMHGGDRLRQVRRDAVWGATARATCAAEGDQAARTIALGPPACRPERHAVVSGHVRQRGASFDKRSDDLEPCYRVLAGRVRQRLQRYGVGLGLEVRRALER